MKGELDIFRKLVVMDRVDIALLQAAFGAGPEYVPFTARYAVDLAGGTQCDQRIRKPNLLMVSKPQGVLPLHDSYALVGLLHAAREGSKQWEFLTTEDYYDYRDLQKFSAAFIIPWDWAMVFNLELYRLGIPLLLPADRWMHTLILMVHVNMNEPRVWAQKWHRRFSQLFPGYWDMHELKHDHLGMINSSVPGTVQNMADTSLWSLIADWFSTTEFKTLPYIHRVDSIADLMRQLHMLDTELICLRMKRFNDRLLHRVSRFYRGLHAAVLGHKVSQ